MTTGVAKEDVPFSVPLLQKLMTLGEADKAKLFELFCIGEMIASDSSVVARNQHALELLRSLWGWESEYAEHLKNQASKLYDLSAEISGELWFGE